eukprot:TRINITY_DN11876_c0_g2_i2.p1 TRINITY_DN11876_c0_g2~~TRINITY_DN11876_c0_g2_i2.p1  ORF type:complete len:719 (+),score=133.22 TRINITY_DN11876_c0_g2_i2:661-2817(+)
MIIKLMSGMIAGLGYTEVNVLYFSEDFQSGQARDFKVPAETEYGVKVNSFQLPSSGENGAKVTAENMQAIMETLRAIRRSLCRVMVVFAIDEEAWDLWSAADSLGMVHGPGWAWFGGDGISGGQFAGKPERVEVFEGTMFMMPETKGRFFPDFAAAWARDMNTTETPEFDSMRVCKDKTVCRDHPEFVGWEPGIHDQSLVCSGYAGLAYDAVVTLAIVADRLIKGSGETPVHPSTLTAEDWLTEMRKLSEEGRNFECLGGDVTYNDKQERDMHMTMLNWQPGWSGAIGVLEDFTPQPVASWTPTGGNQWLVGATVVWPRGIMGEITNTTMPPHVPRWPPQCPIGHAFDSEAGACVPCPAGHRGAFTAGIATCVPCGLGTFQNETAQVVCQPCAAGEFTDESGLSACKTCSRGSFQGDVGKSMCHTCPRGTAQSERGRTSCDRCPPGLFANATNSTSCTPCPVAAHTTAFVGAIAASECGCPAGSYQSKTDPSVCLPCEKGMDCAFGSDEAGFELLAQGLPAGVVPVLQQGFFTDIKSPLSVFRCPDEGYCPGGLPNTCAHGRLDVACTLCPDGYAPDGSACAKCSGGMQALALLVPLGVLLALPIGTYYAANSKLTAGASAFLGASICAGVIITSSQVLGMFSTLSLPWPGGLQETMGTFAVFLVKLDVLGMPCLFGGSDPFTAYAMRAVFGYLLLLLFGVYFLLSKALTERAVVHVA